MSDFPKKRIDFYYTESKLSDKLVISKLLKIVLNERPVTMGEIPLSYNYFWIPSLGEIGAEYDIRYFISEEKEGKPERFPKLRIA